MFLSSLACY